MGEISPNDAELLWRARSEGDESAARVFVERYTPMLLQQARQHRLGDEDIEEVLQVTFCQFFEGLDEFLPQFDDEGTARPMLIQILRRRVIDLIRKHDRQRNYFGPRLPTRDQGERDDASCPALGDLVHSRDADPTAGIELVELWAMVDSLPEQERDAIRMRCLDEVPFSQIGKRFGVSSTQAFRLYQTGLERLRQRLERDE